MKEIQLTRGQKAIVDDEDFEIVSKLRWYADWNPNTKSYYAKRKDGSCHYGMPRFIFGLKKGDKRVVDHINHDTLDNRRCNLRVCSYSENKVNTKIKSNNTSGYVGVGLYKPNGKWVARVSIGNKREHIGYFDTIEQAVSAREKRAEELFGEFKLKENI